ncbi:uncharacterized protein LOC118756274 [Rhagoletis pomonella]|uniref:uncharacterized protein LOC118756274 n=1 Tax=Rhagoletis pomonella TaxID=28610 RepID=UPI001781BF96|nr:uncharacterized protein LOC118756274 [Rhagoletis pomonella]
MVRADIFSPDNPFDTEAPHGAVSSPPVAWPANSTVPISMPPRSGYISTSTQPFHFYIPSSQFAPLSTITQRTHVLGTSHPFHSTTLHYDDGLAGAGFSAPQTTPYQTVQTTKQASHSTTVPANQQFRFYNANSIPITAPVPTVSSTGIFTASIPSHVPGGFYSRQQGANGYASLSQGPMVDCTLSTMQIASRQVVNKELPAFSGKPEEWPLFIVNYEQSTEQCGFSEAENLIRLQRCLKGAALEAVKGKLMTPSTVTQAIETLRMLYGRPAVIHQALQRKLRKEPAVRHDNLETLIQFALAVQNYRSTMHVIGLSAYLNDPMLLSDLLSKLPSDLKLEWGRQVVNMTETDLGKFDDWLFKLATCGSQVVSVSATTTVSEIKGKHSKSRLLVHDVVENNSNKVKGHPQQQCLYCQEDHNLQKCKKCTVLCIRCFKKHFLKNCRSQSRCDINGCTKPHNALLHADDVKALNDTAVMLHTKRESNKIMFRYVPVTLYGKTHSIETYALVDEGSACTLLESDIASSLGLQGPSRELCLRWTGDITQSDPTSKLVSVDISSSDNSSRYTLRNVRTVANRDLPMQTLSESVLNSRKQLNKLPIKPYESVRATILIGIYNAKLGVPLEVRETKGDHLIAAKCRLGWAVYGRVSAVCETSNRVLHICPCTATERLDDIIKANYALEAVGVCKTDDPLKSKADERAYAIMRSTTRYLPLEKRYETGLLWKFDKIVTPNSLPMAMRRLNCLEEKMIRDPKLMDFLSNKISSYEEKGYIRKLKKGESIVSEKTWFLPIFTGANKNKNKTRIVWDAAAAVENVSLNSYLMSGPDLLTSLIGTLMRFRERRVAIAGDIREMFHQIRIRDEDQASQLFLWRNGNRSRQPDVYAMMVMTFGAACSPSLANYVKNENASRFSNIYAHAVNTIHKNTYVDDWLHSADDEEELIELASQVKYIHGEGGFEMHNWLSNSERVQQAISGSKTQAEKCLEESGTLVEKLLGMWWLPQTDELTFVERFDKSVFEESAVYTKRIILRIIMTIYDPLGLLGFY